jgi:hypothetical protein
MHFQPAGTRMKRRVPAAHSIPALRSVDHVECIRTVTRHAHTSLGLPASGVTVHDFTLEMSRPVDAKYEAVQRRRQHGHAPRIVRRQDGPAVQVEPHPLFRGEIGKANCSKTVQAVRAAKPEVALARRWPRCRSCMTFWIVCRSAAPRSVPVSVRISGQRTAERRKESSRLLSARIRHSWLPRWTQRRVACVSGGIVVTRLTFRIRRSGNRLITGVGPTPEPQGDPCAPQKPIGVLAGRSHSRAF